MSRFETVRPSAVIVGALAGAALVGAMVGAGPSGARPDPTLAIGEIKVSETKAEVKVEYNCAKSDGISVLAVGMLQSNPKSEPAAGEAVQPAECDGQDKAITVEVPAGQGKFDPKSGGLVAAGLADGNGESIARAALTYKPR